MSLAPAPIAPADHPRGRALIARGKGWGGALGFAFAAGAGYLNGAVLFDMLSRGLLGGAIGCMAGWAAAVFAARHLVKAEVKAAAERALERRRRALAQQSADAK